MPRRSTTNPPSKPAGTSPRGQLRGVDLGIHMFVSVLVGGAIGYGLDLWLGTLPLLMLLGGFFGFGAWLRLMWKVMQNTRNNG